MLDLLLNPNMYSNEKEFFFFYYVAKEHKPS